MIERRTSLIDFISTVSAIARFRPCALEWILAVFRIVGHRCVRGRTTRKDESIVLHRNLVLAFDVEDFITFFLRDEPSPEPRELKSRRW